MLATEPGPTLVPSDHMNDPTPTMVVFDLGGVFVRIARSWEEGCAAAGRPIHAGSDTPDRRTARRALSAAYQNGELSCDAYFRAIAEASHERYSPEDAMAIHDAWILGEYADLVPLLRRIKDAGLRTGVLSNTNHRHWVQQLEPMEVFGHIDHPHASHLLGLSKPDPAIYRAFETQTGTRASSILFFDDLEENIAAAREAGWHAEQLDYTRETVPQMLEHLDRREMA